MPDSTLPPTTPPTPPIPPGTPFPPTPPVPSTQPVSPVVPPAAVPTPPATPAMDTSSDDEADAAALEALSPFKVLQKKGKASLPMPTAAPVATAPPAAAAPPVQSREELLKQAAEAKPESFILPTEGFAAQNQAPTSIPVPPAPAAMPVSPPPPTPLAPPAPAPLPPVAPPPPPPAAPTPPKAPAQTPPPPLAPPAPGSLAAKLAALQATPAKPAQPPVAPPSTPRPGVGQPGFGVPKKSSNVGLISLVGLLVVLLVFGAAGYILAMGGMRVPVFYPMISGQKTDGMAVIADAKSVLGQEKSYTIDSQITVEPKVADGALPAPISTDVKESVQKIEVSATASTVTGKGTEFIGQNVVALNNRPALSVALDTKSSEAWLAYFPDASNPQVLEVDPTQLSKTLLQVGMRPVSLEDFTAGITEVSKPVARTVQYTDSVKVSAFSITKFDATKLASYFPEGATLGSFTGIVEVAWKGGTGVANRLVSGKLTGSFTYKEVTYTYTGVWIAKKWSAEVDTVTNPSLKQLSEYAGATADTISLTRFIGQLGVGSLALMPNSLDDATPDDSTSDSTDTADSTAQNPTGQTVSAPGTAISLVPSAPTQPASTEAKQRDTQRKADLGLVQTALEAYKKSNDRYPISNGLVQTVSDVTLFNALVPKYLTAMPVDPLTTQYWYEYESDGTTFTLRCVLEDTSDTAAKKGSVFSYYELTSK